MSSPSPNNPFNMDPDQLTQAIGNIAGQSHTIMENFLKSSPPVDTANMDPMGVGKAFMELTAAMMANPQKLVDAQMAAWNAYTNLWFGTAARMMGGGNTAEPPAPDTDRRFRHEAWSSNPFFDFIKQSYLVAGETIQNAVASTEGLDEKTARKVHFYTKQFVDAMSPTNFALTNPEVLEATVASGGENLLRGLRNFTEDFDAKKGRLRTRMTDERAFELGKNVATTPGKVIFQNKLMQLIQYLPATSQVKRRPLLVMAPWINKFYILDLQPKNSFIKWLVGQGHTVFVVSWVNPDATHANIDFQDYIFQGPLAALDAIEQATGEKKVNVIGYCIGGTLLAGTLAYMAVKDDKRIASATFLTALLDFTEPGDLGVFVDEQQLRTLEATMNERGFHDGSEMSTSFNLLRSNDLIWSFFVNHYLLGKDPVPFDLLYWNSDSTCMPAKMHSTYMRAMYLENRFCKPGGMTVGDVAINLRDIHTPAYFISTEEDHIAPWESTFTGAKLLSGPVRFVLGKSGHIAGVVNPPAANKYGYYTGPDATGTAMDWIARATPHEGSWWSDWETWVQRHSGGEAEARQPGDGKLKIIEDAPGSYVRKRI